MNSRFDSQLTGAVIGVAIVFPISVDQIKPVRRMTVLARLRQGGWKHGLILNFNSLTMSDGIRRIVS